MPSHVQPPSPPLYQRPAPPKSRDTTQAVMLFLVPLAFFMIALMMFALYLVGPRMDPVEESNPGPTKGLELLQKDGPDLPSRTYWASQIKEVVQGDDDNLVIHVDRPTPAKEDGDSAQSFADLCNIIMDEGTDHETPLELLSDDGVPVASNTDKDGKIVRCSISIPDPSASPSASE